MSKFPTTIKTASKMKVVQSAIPSTLGGSSSVDDEKVLFKAMVADIFSIFITLTKGRKCFHFDVPKRRSWICQFLDIDAEVFNVLSPRC